MIRRIVVQLPTLSLDATETEPKYFGYLPSSDKVTERTSSNYLTQSDSAVLRIIHSVT